MSGVLGHHLGNVARVAIALERLTPRAIDGMVRVPVLADELHLSNEAVRQCLLDLAVVGYVITRLGADGLVYAATDLGKLPQPEIPERVFKGSASCA